MISLDNTIELTKFMSNIVDFRSPFTSMHSAGVAASAVAIAELMGMSKEECKMMQIAGYLHDIGKLKISNEILEKPGKLNGNGYPFHLKGEDIPLGARIMAVADIFSAITEERPYRKGMEKDKVISVLQENVEQGNISERIVALLIEHYDEIDYRRDTESRIVGKRYFEMLQESQG